MAMPEKLSLLRCVRERERERERGLHARHGAEPTSLQGHDPEALKGREG